jgi:hypothetical protein
MISVDQEKRPTVAEAFEGFCIEKVAFEQGVDVGKVRGLLSRLGVKEIPGETEEDRMRRDLEALKRDNEALRALVAAQAKVGEKLVAKGVSALERAAGRALVQTSLPAIEQFLKGAEREVLQLMGQEDQGGHAIRGCLDISEFVQRFAPQLTVTVVSVADVVLLLRTGLARFSAIVFGGVDGVRSLAPLVPFAQVFHEYQGAMVLLHDTVQLDKLGFGTRLNRSLGAKGPGRPVLFQGACAVREDHPVFAGTPKNFETAGTHANFTAYDARYVLARGSNGEMWLTANKTARFAQGEWCHEPQSTTEDEKRILANLLVWLTDE